jgi:hypothetical protein
MIGQPTVRACARNGALSSAGPDSGGVFARCQSKKHRRQTRKAQLFGISEELGIGFRRIVTASLQIHHPPQCCLNPLIPADLFGSRSGFDF